MPCAVNLISTPRFTLKIFQASKNENERGIRVRIQCRYNVDTLKRAVPKVNVGVNRESLAADSALSGQMWEEAVGSAPS